MPPKTTQKKKPSAKKKKLPTAKQIMRTGGERSHLHPIPMAEREQDTLRRFLTLHDQQQAAKNDGGMTTCVEYLHGTSRQGIQQRIADLNKFDEIQQRIFGRR